jgi:hypothetical protein
VLVGANGEKDFVADEAQEALAGGWSHGWRGRRHRGDVYQTRRGGKMLNAFLFGGCKVRERSLNLAENLLTFIIQWQQPH